MRIGDTYILKTERLAPCLDFKGQTGCIYFRVITIITGGFFLHSTHDPNSKSSVSFYLADETNTLALGKKIAAVLKPGLVIFLNGNLGAGKTTLVRGILHGLGHQHAVKSPTYNLVEIYKFSRLYLYHFDFYRFNDPYEWEEAGFRDYFNADTICLIEWPEKAFGLLPDADLDINFQILETGRNLSIKADTDAGEQCLRDLKH
ncbi:MAG: tRNA (adenosine(37)-N6)-threonylcarbamoyltransferase complex ATPase subunit type 1 TsaE [Burkholderiales bacterium]|nr:tRNA (adenosine(37)-N6)-threonylcarbamoyltransferase complex ATPase subunit type 1 TsaE [Burkholderiales bacterium]